MKIARLFTTGLLFALTFLVTLPGTHAEPVTHSIQIIWDDSAALANPDAAVANKKNLLWQLTEMRRKRVFRYAVLNLVSVNQARNIYTGTPRTLFRNGGHLLD